MTKLTDDAGLLHSDTGPALYHFYFIHGVEFSRRIWKAIVKKRISLIDVLQLPIPDRLAIERYVGTERLFRNCHPHRLEVSKKGNELFVINMHEGGGNLYWLRYTCPSTGKKYLSGIHPHFIQRTLDMPLEKLPQGFLADAAMAWKFGLKLSEYLSIKEEA